VGGEKRIRVRTIGHLTKRPDPNFAKKSSKTLEENKRARALLRVRHRAVRSDYNHSRISNTSVFYLITHSLIHTTHPSLSKRHREEIIIRRKQKREQEEYNDFAIYQRTATRITRR
jgi:hypothetical protein